MGLCLLEVLPELIEGSQHHFVESLLQKLLFLDHSLGTQTDLLQDEEDELPLVFSERSEDALVVVDLVVFLVHAVEEVEIGELVVVEGFGVDFEEEEGELVERFSTEHHFGEVDGLDGGDEGDSLHVCDLGEIGHVFLGVKGGTVEIVEEEEELELAGLALDELFDLLDDFALLALGLDVELLFGVRIEGLVEHEEDFEHEVVGENVAVEALDFYNYFVFLIKPFDFGENVLFVPEAVEADVVSELNGQVDLLLYFGIGVLQGLLLRP